MPRPRPSRPRRVAQLLVAVALLPATALGPALLHAHAADAPIRIPLHAENTRAWLLGVSAAGVAVAQGAPEAENAAGTIYSAAWGARLTPRPQAVARNSSGAGLTGTTLAYTVGHDDVATPWTQPHRLDILTGQDTVDPTGAAPSDQVSDPVFTGDSWVAEDVPASLNGNLRRYPVSGAASTVLWQPGARQLTGFRADATGLLVSYATYLPSDDFWKPTGPSRLNLIDLATGTERRIASADRPITGPVLTPDRAVWVTEGTGGTRILNSAPRSGGTGTRFTESAAGADLTRIAVAGDGTLGYLVAGGTSRLLRLVRDGRKTDVPVPAGSGGLDTLGNDFYTAAGGGAAVAGVYRVRSGAAARVAALPRPEREVANWAFDHGVLRYLDRSGGEPDELALWTRRVNDLDGSPAVTTESATPARLRVLAGGDETPAISFDAGRGAVPSQKYRLQWDLTDRNRRTGVAIEPTPIPGAGGVPEFRPGNPVVSGPYVLMNGLVHRTDGELLFTENVAARQAGRDAVFGSRLVYGMVSSQGRGEVWSVDAENPEPVRLAASTCARAPETAVWGGLSAWTGCDGSTITIGRVTGGGTTRTVPSGLTGAVTTMGLTMNGTALGWVAGGTAYLLDLATPTSSPVALTGETRRMVIDGRSVVREVHRENAVPATVLQVEKLPFKVSPSPRLTGRVAVLGFTPNGDGRHDTWAAQFDTTAPLASAQLRFVSRTGRAARTLTTKKVSDGSIRLVWDGLTSTGRKAPKGVYRWTLTARDASGAKVTTNGRGAVTGTVELG